MDQTELRVMENTTGQYTNETLPCYQKGRMDVNEKSILKLPLTMNEERETASSGLTELVICAT